MVDVPFVSEDFQRAFRNQFPAQQSSGRDLHVSDVVIPVVDFTPTASGASLPENLRQSRNGNTVNTGLIQTDTGANDITGVGAGFWALNQTFNSTGDMYGRIQIVDGVDTYRLSELSGLASATVNQSENFIMYLPAGFTAQTFLAVTSGNLKWNVYCTQLADVNGNLKEPLGYFPQ